MASDQLTEKMELAALLVAEARFTLPEIADRVGVVRSTLWAWRKLPEFIAEVDRQVDERRKEIRRLGIADLENRVSAQNDRWRRMRRVMEARADDPTMQDVPGGSTGLLVRTIKRVVVENDEDDKKSSREVEEFAVDTGLLREIRELEKHTAQELGQWVVKQSVDDGRKGYHPANMPDDL